MNKTRIFGTKKYALKQAWKSTIDGLKGRLVPFKSVHLIVFLFLFSGIPLFAQKPFIDNTKDPEIGIVEHLDEYLPKDIYLINENNERVCLNRFD